VVKKVKFKKHIFNFMENLTIRNILTMVREGRLRVPAFQRGFVWDADRVAFLMDSIYKNYPIGSLLIWRTREQLKYERQLGPFTLPDATEGYPVDYILDGQQRITSIFGVFQSDLEQDVNVDSSWMNIYFDLMAGADAQESQFVALEPADVDATRYFPLRYLFDTVGYRKATRNLDDALAEQVDKVQTRFKEAMIPVQMISTDDKATVAIVFERVNRRAVPLDTLQLLTAWTWSQEFHLQQQFEDLTADLKPFGFQEVGEDNNLLLRCCSAVLSGNASSDNLITLNGAAVRFRFPEVINGLKGAIDFLRRNLHIYSLDNLPYNFLLIPLCVFFAAPDGRQVRITDEQRDTIMKWFWRTCFSKRYNSQPAKTVQTDIEAIVNLRDGHNSELGSFTFSRLSPEVFKADIFRINNVTTKTFIALLSQQTPLSFISGSPISLEKALKEYNRNEFHHMFPKSFLKDKIDAGEQIDYDPNCLANFCFMSRSDNNSLGGDAPSEYKVKMPTDTGRLNAILAHCLSSDTLFSDDFNAFIDERAHFLSDDANSRMG